MNPWRTRCKHSTACCSSVLIGTKRMLGRLTTSQIASASLPSFLPFLRYGATNRGAISFTRVTERLKAPRPFVSTGARFQPDQTGWLLSD